jgi:hypothetical protein
MKVVMQSLTASTLKAAGEADAQALSAVVGVASTWTVVVIGARPSEHAQRSAPALKAAARSPARLSVR